MAVYEASYPLKTSWKLRLVVTETELDAANNRSKVKRSLYIVRGNNDTPFNNSSSFFWITELDTFNGNFNPFRFGGSGTGTNYSGTPVGGAVLIAEYEEWVTHNSNGTGSVVVAASHAAAATLGTATIPTQSFSLTTLVQAPSTPTSIGLAYVSDSQVTVSWTNNYPSNGVPTSNQIRTSVNGGAFSEVASISPASSLAISAAANRKIVAQVRATNSAGSSAWSTSSPAVFTTPAAPSGVSATKDADGDITIAWTSNVAFSEHQHVVEHGTISGGVTTWDGSPLATVASGSGSFKHVDPDPAEVHVYRVFARNTDSAALQSSKVSSNSVQLLAAPLKPTVATLPGFADAAADFVFAWTHVPVDTTPQAAYELEFSTNGGSSWSSTGKTTATTSAHTIEGGTYDPDDALTMRVRTWGQATSGGSDGTGASPWSDPVTVTFKSLPVAEILSPADGSTWSEADITVALGFSQDEGASFVRATILLWQGATVLEVRQTTTLAATLLSTPVANGGSYAVTVTMLDSNGLTSDPVAAYFDVEYTLPVTPSVAITYHPELGWAQLDLTFPEPGEGEVAAAAVSVYRTIDGVREPLYVAYPVTASGLTLLDRTPTIHGSNEYTVRSLSEDGAAADTVEVLVTAEDSWAFLSSGQAFGDVVGFYSNLVTGSVPANEHALFRAAGRTKRIAQFGTGRDLVVDGVTTIVPGSGSSWQEIEEFVKAARLVCYRDATGRRVFGTLQGSISEIGPVGAEFAFRVTESEAT